jgi:hypothetical protein
VLDGTDSGEPGSDYRAALTWRNLVIDPPSSKKANRTKATNPTVKLTSRPAAHAKSHTAALFARARAFRR